MTEFHPHQPGYYQIVQIESAFIESKIAIGKHRTIYITSNCGNFSFIHSKMKPYFCFDSTPSMNQKFSSLPGSIKSSLEKYWWSRGIEDESNQIIYLT